ncbi:hypothetical protein E4U24_003006 [Claviceps purpurea]|nr:hypothetical protein E4U24_003006 [Claviceps purpurea]
MIRQLRIKSTSKSLGKIGRADLFCHFRRDGTEKSEFGDLVWIAERKSPFTLRRTMIGAPLSDGEIDLEKVITGDNSDETYLLQRSSPSYSRPWWTKASAMDGFVDTREAMISLHIRDDDLSTIEYHLSYPSSDGHEWRRWQYASQCCFKALCFYSAGHSSSQINS